MRRRAKKHFADFGGCDIVLSMTSPFRPGRSALLLLVGLVGVQVARADCSLTNLGIAPLPEMAFTTYASNKGGLYPNSLNTRPPAHEAAGIAIANAIQPLDSAGTVNTNTGKIGLLSIGMSNVTQEWATKPGANHFTSQATNDPSLNPQVVIADGGISGQDAVDWTNFPSANWSWVATNRLASVGLTTNQVQVIWMKQAIQFAGTNGPFPVHAQMLRTMTEQIIRNAKVMFPNLKIMYLASRTRAYTNANPSAPNPEPYAFESGFSVRWVIEDQIKGTNNLNHNPSSGPVVAPWLSWGPYLWADGTTPRGDGFTWQCTDTEPSDLMHPSVFGVQKVGTQLLAFFKTDPTATPWFLKPSGEGAPTCAPTASVTNGFRPLTVNFTANPVAGSAPFHDGKWTFEDGEFATNANPVKVFKTPGLYHARFTVTDTNGNTAQEMVAVKVNAKLTDWLTAKFSAADMLKAEVSGPTANPDGDAFPNLLEFALGLEPMEVEPPDTVTATFTNNMFTLTYPHYKYAGDAPLTLEVTSDFATWTPLTVTQSEDDDPVELLTFQEPMTNSAPRFFRLKAQLQPTQ
jgi:PKD repeat protein